MNPVAGWHQGVTIIFSATMAKLNREQKQVPTEGYKEPLPKDASGVIGPKSAAGNDQRQFKTRKRLNHQAIHQIFSNMSFPRLVLVL